MDLGTLLRTVVRRWYVTMPALLLVFGAALAVIDSSEPEFSATRSVVLVRTGLLPPEAVVAASDGSDAADDPLAAEATDGTGDELDDGEVTPRNPYTEFNASVTVTAEVLQEVVQSGESRLVLRQAGLSDDYSVSVDENAPILEIEAIADNSAVAIESASRVAQLVAEDLAARQDRFGVPDETRIVTDDVVVPDRTTRLDTARDRALIGVAILGVVFVVSVGLAAELFARSRAGHRRSPAAGRRHDDTVDDGDDTVDDESADDIADDAVADRGRGTNGASGIGRDERAVEQVARR